MMCRRRVKSASVIGGLNQMILFCGERVFVLWVLVARKSFWTT
jgi:hypothetical protein